MPDLHSAEQMVEAAFPIDLTPAQQLQVCAVILRACEGGLIWLQAFRPTPRTVGRVRASLEPLVKHLDPLALDGDAAHCRYALRAAHLWLRTTGERWDRTSPEGRRQGVAWAVKTLVDARRCALLWHASAELAHGRARAGEP